MPTRQPTTPAFPVPILNVLAGAVRRPLAKLPSRRRADSSLTAETRQLIDDIRRLNQTASFRFLAGFDRAALRQYLDHLQEARDKRARPATAPRRTRERVLV